MSKEAERKKQGGLLRSKKKGEGTICLHPKNATILFRCCRIRDIVCSRLVTAWNVSNTRINHRI